MSREIKDKLSREWARALGSALRQWRERDRPKVTDGALAKELGISYNLLRHIARGDMIANDPEVYARLYRLTNLPEARPWLLPPLQRSLPRGDVKPSPRGMTAEKYQAWLAQQQRKATIPKPAAASQRDPVLGGSFGAFFDALLQELQLTRLEMRRLREFLQPSSMLSGEVGELVERLLAQMSRAVSGTRANRDAFYKRYGQDVARLLAMADALSDNDPKQREKKSARIREIGTLEVGT